jgi:methylenetetrahydrofolate reductase (NADPH)
MTPRKRSSLESIRTNDYPATKNSLAAALRNLSLEIGVHDLAALQQYGHLLAAGGRVYVNAVAGEGTAARIKAAEQIKAAGFRPVPHIAARRMQSEQALDEYLAGFVERAGVNEILLIGGDLSESLGPYDSALDVIESGLPAKHGITRIGIAGYPDGHAAIDAAVLHQTMQEKLAACKSAAIDPYVVTQFSFQATTIIDWCRATHEKFAGLPIHAGIPGPAKLGTLLRYARICGVQTSVRKLQANKNLAFELLRRAAPWEQLAAIGQYRLDTGQPLSAHLFTFGGLEETTSWLQKAAKGKKDTSDVVEF